MDEVYLDNTQKEYFAGVQYNSDMTCALMVCSDSKLNYEIVPKANMYSD
eukprot:SAG11_NODE_36665_length_260_cov_1.049689_1_plen_48_part_10